jgi:hypothetical protein
MVQEMDGHHEALVTFSEGWSMGSAHHNPCKNTKSKESEHT